MPATTIDRAGTARQSARYVLPKFICRVSGAPVGTTLGMVNDDVARWLEQLWRVEDQLDADRESLSAALFSAVSGVADKKARNKLVELRRTLYNGRGPSESQLAAAATLDAALVESVWNATALLAERKRLLDDAPAVYDGALATARARLRAAVADTDFQAALALSSETLFKNVEAYRAANSRLSGSRLEQIERGLARYYTRMAMKATPFSRFCAIVGGELGVDDAGPLLRFTRSPREKRTIIRLNKRICAELSGRMNRQPAVRDRLRIEPNPTLVTDGQRFVFLAGVAGRELFQRVPMNEVLDIIVNKARVQPSPTFGEVVAALAADERLETTTDEARAFLDRLLSIGLLRTHAVVAEQEADWLDPLVAFLAPIEDEVAQEGVRLLRELATLVDCYASGTAAVRAKTLTEIRSRLKEGYGALGLPPWAPHELPLYEDATADARMVMRGSNDVESVFAKLADWVRLTLPLSSDRGEMATMRHFFDTFYGSRGDGGVTLLAFYEDFYREHFKSHLEKSQQAQAGRPEKGYALNNPFDLEAIKKLRHAEGLLHETVREAWSKDARATEVNVTRAMMARAIGPMGGDRWSEQRSVSVFCQLLSGEDGDARMVLAGGNYALGFGKFYSRFLYLLPQEWESEVVGSNERLTSNLLAEICGDAAFNANLHPPLLPFEISYPTGQRGGSADQLLSSELRVSRDPADAHSLMLTTNEGQRVWPVDLGFLSLNRRPPLYQLLTKFSPVKYFGMPMFPFTPVRPQDRTEEAKKPFDTVMVRPRITFEETIILSRRIWLVPQAVFPAQQRGESDAEYLLRIARWRRSHDIPRRVYVRVKPMNDPAKGRITDEPPKENAGEAQEGEDLAPEAAEEQEVGTDKPRDSAAPATPHDPKDAAPGRPNTGAPPMNRQSRDFRKPQFIDFENPILVQLFARLPATLKFFELTIEECLPSADHLPTADGDAYATEMILQVSFPEDRP